jgi:glycosyltransferase involved in cell wall biosynthesis
MSQNNQNSSSPLVSVLVPTYNRPVYLYQALSSILRQSYVNLQIIVVNDGGEDVSGLIQSFNDDRLEFIDRKENRGKAFSLNQALSRSRGKYIAYLDDDDIYYPEHIGTLVEALETQTECQVAYSDFYKVYCRVAQNKDRQILSKVVDVSRDFDRFFMLYFNHVLHVCLMHRRDLLEKTGLYNENLNVLIDWDMTRRLVFFSDFHHVCRITGEYYEPMGDCDRISIQQRKDKNKYADNVLAIRAARPPKPWPKIDDLSIILIADKPDKHVDQSINLIRRHTFYPHIIHYPLCEPEGDWIVTCAFPDMVSFYNRQVDIALEKCHGRYVAIVPAGFPMKDFWLEKSLYALIKSLTGSKAGYELEDATDTLWSVVVEKNDLLIARKNFPGLSIRESLQSAGITLRKPGFEELPFQFDTLLSLASSAQKDGNWLQAAKTYEYIAERFQNRLWMKRLAAKAFYNAGVSDMAANLCHQINMHQLQVETLLLEGRIKRQEKKFTCAIELLTQGQSILESGIA